MDYSTSVLRRELLCTLRNYQALSRRDSSRTRDSCLLCLSSARRHASPVAFDSFVRRPRLRKGNELERACADGTLCMVIRDRERKPEVSDTIRDMAVGVDEFLHDFSSTRQ
jgi:hypothetical protein